MAEEEDRSLKKRKLDESGNSVRPKIVVVGGGFGGLAATCALQDLGTTDLADVTVLEQKDFFTIAGCWQYPLTNRAELSDTEWSLAETRLNKVDIKANTTLKAMDLNAKTLTTITKQGQEGEEATATLSFDYLVFSIGVVTDRKAFRGLDERTFDIADRNHTLLLKDRLEALDSGIVTVLVVKKPYKCPPSPYEYAFIIDDLLRTRQVRDSVKVRVIIPGEFTIDGERVKTVFTAHMASKDIEFINHFELEELATDSDDRTVIVGKDGSTYVSDLIVAVGPQLAPSILSELTNANGFVPVDLHTNRVSGFDSVYVIGDSCHVNLPESKCAHPKAGEFAAQMGHSVAGIIDAQVRGHELPLPKRRSATCYAESGAGFGIAVSPNFDRCLSGGMPEYNVAGPSPNGSQEKLDWVNGHVQRIFGEHARLFSPRSILIPSLVPTERPQEGPK